MGFFLFYILGPALVGGLMLFAGQRLRLRDQKMHAWQEPQVRSLLAEWRIVVAPEKETKVVKALYACLTMLWSSMLMAIGTVMLLFVGVTICLTLSMFGTLLINLSPQIQPFVELLYAVFVLGSGVGLLFALKQIRRRAMQGVRYGDLRRRQVADYRSLFIQGLPLLCLLLLVTETVLLAPYIGMSVHLEFVHAVFSLPAWIIWVIPALMALFMLLTETFIARVVTFPRLFVMLDPELARGFDDMLRAIFVGWFLCCEFLAFGSLTWAQYGLLTMNTLHSGLPVYLNVILLLSYICGFLIIIAGILVSARHGRLGGQISRQSQPVKLEHV